MLPPEVEQMLIQAAVERAQSAPSNELATGAGAAIGGLAGVGIGHVPHTLGKAVSGARDALAAQRGLTPVKQPMGMLKPGGRMAGGLVGLIAGGALGQGVRNMMIENSPEAEILARYQAGIPAPGDDIRLQQLLADQYKKMGLS